MTTISLSNAGSFGSEDSPAEFQVCESCKTEFVPVSDEPLCGDCVRELFESKPRALME
jgi:hypothetical protein